MLREVSIVLSKENSNYRRVAQLHWGLTDDQMEGMHVHHFPSRSQGGRNIPEHLYVSSESMHHFGWHKATIGLVSWASSAGKETHRQKDDLGRSLHALRTLSKLREEKNSDGKSVFAVHCGNRTHKEKNEEGKSINAVRAGKSTAEKRVGYHDPEVRSRATRAGGKASAKKRQRPIEVTNIESGESWVFENKYRAAESLDLDRSHLHRVAEGKAKSHKGFRARYL